MKETQKESFCINDYLKCNIELKKKKQLLAIGSGSR